MNLLARILRLVLAAIFAGAAISKIADPAAFAVAIQTYRVLPSGIVGIVAIGLPWLELWTGLALLWPRHRIAASWLLLALTSAFIAALAQAWLRGLDINCGCFGSAATVSGLGYWRYLGRDALLLAAFGWLLWRDRCPVRREPKPESLGRAE